MVEPTENDIGRLVIYTGNRYPGGKIEEGFITSFNKHCVFVRYRDDTHSKATSRDDLVWVTPELDGDPPPATRLRRAGKVNLAG